MFIVLYWLIHLSFLSAKCNVHLIFHISIRIQWPFRSDCHYIRLLCIHILYSWMSVVSKRLHYSKSGHVHSKRVYTGSILQRRVLSLSRIRDKLLYRFLMHWTDIWAIISCIRPLRSHVATSVSNLLMAVGILTGMAISLPAYLSSPTYKIYMEK